MKQAIILIQFLALCLFTACSDSQSVHSTTKYREGFVESEKVKLQYLDWNGKGETLVLITGLGDTPYIFEDLAGDLSNNFRVIAYSRRSHGKSRTRNEKYDNATFVSDLKLLLDSLKIDKASLLGWSMGGNEITEFAILYPHRVNKLIYFEAGYDLSDGGFQELLTNIPKSFLPDSLEMKSLDNYREWYHRFWFGDMQWNNALEANLQASVKPGSDGRIETIPDDRIFNSILKEAMNYKRRYERIEAPSLVIYTRPFLYPPNEDPETIEAYEKIENNIVTPWRSANRRRIKTELQNVSFVDAPIGSHTSFLFRSHDFLVESISSFLSSAK